MDKSTVQKQGGIDVFGSAIMRVEPDFASIQLTVSREDKEAKKAFQQARKAAAQVQNFLAQAKLREVGFSRLTLHQSYEYIAGIRHYKGYVSKMGIRILLHDLDRLEELLSGAVEAGANELNAVEFKG
jgi:uncharacterized protein YggE